MKEFARVFLTLLALHFSCTLSLDSSFLCIVPQSLFVPLTLCCLSPHPTEPHLQVGPVSILVLNPEGPTPCMHLTSSQTIEQQHANNVCMCARGEHELLVMEWQGIFLQMVRDRKTLMFKRLWASVYHCKLINRKTIEIFLQLYHAPVRHCLE